MNSRLAVLCAALLFLPKANAAGGLAEQITNDIGTSSLDRPVSPLSGAQVVAGQDDSNASLKLSRASSFTNSKDNTQAYFTVWSLTASAPLNKDTSDTNIASLDGLASAASLELKYSRFIANGRRRPFKDPAVVAKLDEICARAIAEKKRQTGTGLEPKQECDEDFVSQYGSSNDLHDYHSAFWDISNSNRWIWGGSVKVGYQSFDFVDTSSAKASTENHKPWSLGGFLAFNWDQKRTLFTGTFKYQHAYKEGDNGAVCPTGATATVTCATGSVGAPQERNKKIFSFEARRAWPSMGAAITVNYEAEARVWGFELPAYFLKDKDGNFIGGVKAGWRNDTHVFTPSVFVGTTFGLF